MIFCYAGYNNNIVVKRLARAVTARKARGYVWMCMCLSVRESARRETRPTGSHFTSRRDSRAFWESSRRFKVVSVTNTHSVSLPLTLDAMLFFTLKNQWVRAQTRKRYHSGTRKTFLQPAKLLFHKTFLLQTADV